MSERPIHTSVFRPVAGVDQTVLVQERDLVTDINRRGFLRGALSLGALVSLTGCDISNTKAVRNTLKGVSRWNDRVQATLFSPHRLAPTFTDAQVLKPPRFNAFYGVDDVKPVDPTRWKLQLGGSIRDRAAWNLQQLNALPQVTQITRHICVEGWDYIGKWSGVSLRLFLEQVGADFNAGFVNFRCADGYSSSLDMATALHPQTQLTLRYADQVLPDAFGFPLRLRAATKLGFKTPKWITVIEVLRTNPGGYWEDRGYNWFSGI